MKKTLLIASLLALALAACGKKDEAPAVDTAASMTAPAASTPDAAAPAASTPDAAAPAASTPDAAAPAASTPDAAAAPAASK